MKMFGKKIQGPNVEILVIPRAEGDIVFKAQAVLDYDRFDQLVPRPKPPKIIKRGEKKPKEDFENKEFLIAVDQYATKKTDFLILESLRITEGLEWETVDYNDSNTWGNFRKELKDSGFTESEVSFIINAVWNANSLNEDKLEEARKRFLALQEEQQSHELLKNGEHTNMPSGEPAKDLESLPQT